MEEIHTKGVPYNRTFSHKTVVPVTNNLAERHEGSLAVHFVMAEESLDLGNQRTCRAGAIL